MTKAPERMWVLRPDAVMAGKYQTVGGLSQVWVGDDGVEYVRADLAPAPSRSPLIRGSRRWGRRFDTSEKWCARILGCSLPHLRLLTPP